MLNISTSTNKAYLDYASVMLASLCENSAGEHVRCFVLHGELDDVDFDRMRVALRAYDIDLNFIHIESSLFTDCMVQEGVWTVEAYYRLKLADVLPEDVDRILYLDVDVIVNHPIPEFYHLDFEGCELAATVDNSGILEVEFHGMRAEKMNPLLAQEGNYYFNSGVCLMNMDLIRERCSFDFYKKQMEEWNYEMEAPDQDILNYVHAGKVLYVDPLKYDAFAIHIFNYDVMDFEKFDEYASIIHYSGPKPWQHRGAHYPFEKIWWRYARKLPIYEELLDRFLNGLFDDDFMRGALRSARTERNTLRKQNEELKGKIEELSGALMEMVEMNEALLKDKEDSHEV